jgi:chitin synthase
MDYRDRRPPRSAYHQQYHPSPPQSPPIYPEQQHSGYHHPSSPPPSAAPYPRPSLNQYNEGRSPNISFQNVERGDRQGPLDQPRQRNMPSAYQNQLSPTFVDAEGTEYLDTGRVGRKKSLVKPDREKIEPGHRQWHYRTHAAQMENERVGVQPSSAYFRSGQYPI